MSDTKACGYCGEPYPRKGRLSAKGWAASRYCGRACQAKGLARVTDQFPGSDELRRYYIEARMTTKQVGDVYGVNQTSVLRWLRRAGIQVRPAAPSSSNVRTGTPTKEELADLVHVQHKSYREIGAIYGVDRRLVGMWLEKYEIPKPSSWDTRYGDSKPDLPDAETLRELYASGLSTAAIGAGCESTGTVILALCKKHGIERRRSGFRYQGDQACEDGTKVRSAYERRVGNWLLARGIPFKYEPRVPFHERWLADFLVGGWFVEVWGIVGWEAYDRKRRLKTDWYRRHGLPLIELEPGDFGREARLDRVMSRVLSPARTIPRKLVQPSLF